MQSEIFNNTIVYNTAGEAGGGIDFYTNSSPNLTNNIFWGNSAPHGNQAFLYTNNVAPNFYYNDVQGGLSEIGLNYEVYFTGDYENNIDEYPLFDAPGNNDFNLMELSPCIDAGDPLYPFDPDMTVADIGALFYNQDTSALETDDDLTARAEPRIQVTNPFRPNETISFEIVRSSRVELAVYDISGRRVKELFAGRSAASNII